MPSGKYKRTKENNIKMSKRLKGRIFSDTHKKNLSKCQIGKIVSLETREKLSKLLKGRIISPETRQRMSDSRKGEKGNNWKGGVTAINQIIRCSREYKDWRIKVFQRDDYTCQECGSRGVMLHADHIKPFAYYPELRLVIENGRTLCVPCHKKTETFASGAVKLFKNLTHKTQ